MVPDALPSSPSVSLGSSAAESHDAVLQALKDKMRLEGQLEALSLEASQVTGAGGGQALRLRQARARPVGWAQSPLHPHPSSACAEVCAARCLPRCLSWLWDTARRFHWWVSLQKTLVNVSSLPLEYFCSGFCLF